VKEQVICIDVSLVTTPTGATIRLQKGDNDVSRYENANIVRKSIQSQDDGGELTLQLLHGDGPATGQKCIHRVLTDQAGQLKSDIVYFYDERVDEAVVSEDFDLLCSPRLMSISQLHHTSSMLNRGTKTPRRG
jgi:hypothetical protein